MAIYVTGDIHGEIGRFFGNDYKSLKNNDYVIVAGDFGLLWHENVQYYNMIKAISGLDFTVLWVDGNHENHDWIDRLTVTRWKGGDIHQITDNCIHLMRGQVYEIEDKTFFTFGGATSIDRVYRVPGISWWEREVPSYMECNEALDNLMNYDYTVDYIITHAASDQSLFKVNPRFNTDNVTNFLAEIERNIKFKHWYFGHYHEDREIDSKHTMLYYKLIKLT